jgi:hypothetical protein
MSSRKVYSRELIKKSLMLLAGCFLIRGVSLFFGREEYEASLVVNPSRGGGLYGADSLVIGNRTYHYRYPLTFPMSPSQTETANVIFGVLSAPSQLDRRTAIRQTWGKGKHLFFIVAGDWKEIKEEFAEQKDLLWLDMVEQYYWGLTPKTFVFYHASLHHAGSFDYAFKADDDIYLNTSGVERRLSVLRPQYWGQCLENVPAFRDETSKWVVPKHLFPPDFYPIYTQGNGYALSKESTRCAVSRMPFMSPMMPMEDVAIGMLAEECKLECSIKYFDKPQKYLIGNWRNGGRSAFLLHGVQPQDMKSIHERKPFLSKLVHCGKIKTDEDETMDIFAYNCEQCLEGKQSRVWCQGECVLRGGHCIHWSQAFVSYK